MTNAKRWAWRSPVAVSRQAGGLRPFNRSHATDPGFAAPRLLERSDVSLGSWCAALGALGLELAGHHVAGGGGFFVCTLFVPILARPPNFTTWRVNFLPVSGVGGHWKGQTFCRF